MLGLWVAGSLGYGSIPDGGGDGMGKRMGQEGKKETATTSGRLRGSSAQVGERYVPFLVAFRRFLWWPAVVGGPWSASVSLPPTHPPPTARTRPRLHPQGRLGTLQYGTRQCCQHSPLLLYRGKLEGGRAAGTVADAECVWMR